MLFAGDVRAEIGSYDACQEMGERLPADYPRWDGLGQAQYLEAAYLMPGYILSSQGDRVAMAHSVEGRFPFLDHRVVEFAARLPARLKIKVLDEKYLLKRGADGLVPRSVRERPKQPYRAPEGKCFFAGPLDYVDALLSPKRVEEDGLFNPFAVQKLVGKFRQGRATGFGDNMGLLGVLSTQLVVDQFVRNVKEEMPHAAHRAATTAVRTR